MAYWAQRRHIEQEFVVCSEINRGGLPMLYEIILEIAGPELKCALEVQGLFCIHEPYDLGLQYETMHTLINKA